MKCPTHTLAYQCWYFCLLGLLAVGDFRTSIIKCKPHLKPIDKKGNDIINIYIYIYMKLAQHILYQTFFIIYAARVRICISLCFSLTYVLPKLHKGALSWIRPLL